MKQVLIKKDRFVNSDRWCLFSGEDLIASFTDGPLQRTMLVRTAQELDAFIEGDGIETDDLSEDELHQLIAVGLGQEG